MTLSIRNLGFKYGAITAAALIVLSLILGINEYKVPGLYYLHFLLLLGGITMAYLEVRRRTHMHRINYLPGLGTGIWVSFVAAIIFGIYKIIYANVDDNYIPGVIDYVPFKDSMNGPMLALWDAWWVLAVGVVLSFLMMQLFKRNRGPEAEAQEEAAEKHPERDLHPKV
jgi:hypothetical protein